MGYTGRIGLIQVASNGTFSAAEIKTSFLCKPSIASLFLFPVIKAYHNEKKETYKYINLFNIPLKMASIRSYPVWSRGDDLLRILSSHFRKPITYSIQNDLRNKCHEMDL